MRAGFEKEAKESNRARLLLSAALSAGRDTIDSAYQIPQVAEWVEELTTQQMSSKKVNYYPLSLSYLSLYN